MKVIFLTSIAFVFLVTSIILFIPVIVLMGIGFVATYVANCVTEFVVYYSAALTDELNSSIK